jgi:nitrate reductase assembly molybdenum cofactor insertion protein NarJ
MRGQLRRFSLPESAELPDHLTHVLHVLGRMDGGEAGDFSANCVMPALERILAGLADKSNPYEKTLSAIISTLRANHGSARRGHVPLPVIQPGAEIAIGSSEVLP